jgi:hypothetical protein
MKEKNAAVECADGFRMSVQAHEGAYCSPRDDTGPYTEVEVGFPSDREDLLMEYAETPSEPTNTVYCWVPRQIVLMVIAKHGGMVSGGLPDGISNLWHYPGGHSDR